MEMWGKAITTKQKCKNEEKSKLQLDMAWLYGQSHWLSEEPEACELSGKPLTALYIYKI